jgi:GNAT superfamily N-acetyltransferase
MQINRAEASDIPELVELLIALFSLEHEFTPDPIKHRQGIAKLIARPELGEIFVYREQQKIVAMITVLYSVSTALGEETAVFEDMIVHQQYRHKGVGSKLMSHAIEHVKDKGCKRITLLTDSDNTDAHQFYKKHHFEQSNMVLFKHFTS